MGMADCGVSLGGALGCLENFGGAVANGWNGLPDWAKAAIIITVVAVVIVATVGIAAPELLPAIPFLLTGDIGILGGGAATCEEDPAVCTPPPEPTSPVGGSGNPGPIATTGPGAEGLVDTSRFFGNVERPDVNACSLGWTGCQYGSYPGYPSPFATSNEYTGSSPRGNTRSFELASLEHSSVG